MVRVRISVRIRFRVWLVSCYAHVFVLLQGGIVALAQKACERWLSLSHVVKRRAGSNVRGYRAREIHRSSSARLVDSSEVV